MPAIALADQARAQQTVAPEVERRVLQQHRLAPNGSRRIALAVEVDDREVERRRPAHDLPGLVDEFARTIRREQDLVREARSLERLAAQFENDATVRFPRVCWERTTAAVLTSEFLDGRKLSELDAEGVGPFARRLIARRGADAMLKQVLVHGFFHADPHPGNLLVLDGCVSADERDSFLAACDCYVSLHRSEGFGLTMSEAMALGKPVVATGYSGNLEFMNAGNSHLVPYRLVTVPPGWWAHAPGAEWAEPDVEAAGRLMRDVYEHGEEAPQTAAGR